MTGLLVRETQEAANADRRLSWAKELRGNRDIAAETQGFPNDPPIVSDGVMWKLNRIS